MACTKTTSVGCPYPECTNGREPGKAACTYHGIAWANLRRIACKRKRQALLNAKKKLEQSVRSFE